VRLRAVVRSRRVSAEVRILCLLELAECARWEGDWAEATQRGRRAVVLSVKAEFPHLSSASTLELGRVALARDDPAGARDKFLKAAAGFHSTGTVQGEALSHCDLGLAYRLLGQVKRAHEQFDAVAAIAERVRDPELRAAHHLLGGWLGWSEDRYGEGVRHLRLAVRALRNSGHLPRRLEAECALAAVLILADRGEEARRILGSVNRTARRIGCRRILADSHLHLAEIYRLGDKNAAAHAELNRALVLYRTLGCRLGESWALGGIGEILVTFDRYTEAEDAYGRSLRLARATQFRQGEAWALDDLGELATHVDDYAAAGAWLKDAARAASAIGDVLGLGNVHRDLAELHSRQEDHATAVRHLLAARRAYRSIGEPMSEGHTLVELAKEHRATGSLRRAEVRAREAVKLLTPVADQLGLANAMLELGKLKVERGDRDGGVRDLERARAIYRRIGAGLGVGEARLALGRVLVGTAEGIAHLRAAREVFRRRRFRLGEAEALAELAARHAASGRAILAHRFSALAVGLLEELRSATGSGSARVRVYRARGWIYRRALHDASAVGAGSETLRIVDSARAAGLATLIRRGGLQLAGPIAALSRRVVQLEASLAAHEPSRAKLDEEVQPASARLRSELRRAREDLERESSVFAAAFSPAREARTHRRLLPTSVHAVLYEIGPSEGRSGAPGWVVHSRPGGTVEAHQFRIPPAVLRWARRWASGEPGWLAHPAAAEAEEQSVLAELLFPRQVLRAISERHPCRLVIVPTGVLWRVPLASLPIASMQMVDLCELSYAPSLQFLSAMGRPADDAASQAPGSVAYLRGDLASRTGLRSALQKHLPPLKELTTRQLRAGGAISASVLTLLAHGNARLGLAHGLELSPKATLTAGELLGSRLPPVVVFGSCSSGSLEMEAGGEPLGLPTACLVAGARSVICALHPVDEAAAADIQRVLYSELASGRSPGAALRLAQLAHRRRCTNCRPAHWAAWVGIGRTWEPLPAYRRAD
jgi:tetratricopeptide (TPR) repeat protein